MIFNISNKSEIEQSGNKKLGSIIDIDVYLKENGNTIIDQFDSILKDAHIKEKELFFSLLKEDFLKEFNPEY
ncbi:unnamed protein product [marine sediment metagenome]|uniref:Uncharacterized protein n=1 Tax=marine sediment metagenome TaxID=412755 RepID=X1MPN3_9ZZZZ